MNTSTHIVYNNRLQHDFYEGGFIIPVFCGAVIGIVILLIGFLLIERMNKGSYFYTNTQKFLSNMVFLLAACGWVLTTYLMIN